MRDNINDRAGAIALCRIFGFQPKISKRIVEALGSCSALFGMSGQELEDLFGPYSKFRPMVSEKALLDAERELERLENLGYKVITILDQDYPSLLKNCDDAPSCLFVRSASEPSEIFNSNTCISIVGTRDISMYGREFCTRIVRTLAQAPDRPAIVSGLALGVDITAHLAALDAGLPTIAVIPVGIDDIYPPSHRIAAGRIAAAEGSAIITDYPPGTAPLQINFLRRNRIIAGMSRSTILIESKAKGGGLLTARLAEGYGREVFALPGRIDDARSAGCNALIQQKIAEPICSLSTLPAVLGLGRSVIRRKADLEQELIARYPDNEDCRRVGIAVRENRGLTADELAGILDMRFRDVSRAISRLELDGFVSTDLLGRCAINVKIA